MKRLAAFGSACALVHLLLTTAAYAQTGPKGPAEIIRRAASSRDARDKALLQQSGNAPPAHDPVKGADSPASKEQGTPVQPPVNSPAGGGQVPPGHPAVAAEAGEAGEAPVGNDPHTGQEGAPPRARRSLAVAEPSSSVPVGTILVRVLDSKERQAANADLTLGTMNSDNSRATKNARTGPDGTYRFEALAYGDKQAYRVNLLFQGAKYSSMPFRLPTDRGFEVTLRELETTRDDREVVLYVGATSIELRDERIKVVQQARLVNIGAKTYLFPEGGQLVHLPKGILTFQPEEVMTDQHVREEKGVGMRVSGSLPPGEATLTWGFDLPVEGTSLDLSFDLPWTTFAYRVLVDAVPGMNASAEGFPPLELHEDGGRRFLVTEVVKRVGDPPLRSVKIHVRDIPGPGPMRIIATALAVLILGGGLYFAARPVKQTQIAASGPDLNQHRERILARARELEAERARGDIGPEYHATSMKALEEELAAVLYEQRRAASAGVWSKSSG